MTAEKLKFAIEAARFRICTIRPNRVEAIHSNPRATVRATLGPEGTWSFVARVPRYIPTYHALPPLLESGRYWDTAKGQSHSSRAITRWLTALIDLNRWSCTASDKASDKASDAVSDAANDTANDTDPEVHP